MTDPTQIEATLARISERVAHRATPDALAPDDWDDPDLIAAARSGLHHARLALWHRTIPARFHDAHLEEIPDAIRPELSGWAEHPDGRNLVLVGPVGVGKTHAAVAAARRQFFAHAEIRFLPVVELLDLLRPGGPEGALYDLTDVDVLIVDDVGNERSTDWTAERLYALINRRWLEEVPTIATSNLAPTRSTAPDGYQGPTLEESLGARTFSRLIGGAVTLNLAGPDRRRNP